MFQVFHMYVAKVDLNVASVAMVIYVCFKCFISFQSYVASGSTGCFKSRFGEHMLQWL